MAQISEISSRIVLIALTPKLPGPNMSHAEPAIADEPSTREGLTEGGWHLPRRDFVLLPLIFVMTIVALLVGGETAARLIYVQADDVDLCLYNTTSGPRHRPFCSSRDKVWDGPWVTQLYNACGYRTAEPCAPRPPGALRVVVLGSSIAQGSKVDYAESFAARSSAALSNQCGASVDFQNLASSGEYLDRIDLKDSGSASAAAVRYHHDDRRL